MSERIKAVMDGIDAAQAVVEVPLNAQPLDFLMAVYRDSGQPMNRRMKAAEIAAQYVHPKLSAIAVHNTQGDFGVMLERAIERSNSVMKLIEAKPEAKATSNGSHLGPSPNFSPLRRRA
jgi:hypothetical protein